MRNSYDHLCCLNCSLCDSLKEQENEGIIYCYHCKKSYQFEQGVPLMVRNWQKHEADLIKVRSEKPDWYIEKQFSEIESPWRHHLAKRRLYVQTVLNRLIVSNGKRVLRLLDLGCGDGNNLAWLSDYACELYGSDYNMVRLVRAKLLNPKAKIFLADILDYPIADNFFDVIYFNHVLEHIKDDELALKTVFRILKPGGVLVLGVPNEGAWWWQLAYRRNPETLANTDHVNFYTLKIINDKVFQTGFTIVERKMMGWGPPDWAWDMRLRKYKILDDLFELIGKTFLYDQASSIYLIAIKQTD